MTSLLCVFKFQLIEYGLQGTDPPNKTQISNNVVSILNNSTTSSTSFKPSSMTSTGSANASPSAKMSTPTRVSYRSHAYVILTNIDRIQRKLFYFSRLLRTQQTSIHY